MMKFVQINAKIGIFSQYLLYFYHSTDCSFRDILYILLINSSVKTVHYACSYMFLLGNLDYSDDTAMARCVVQSILTRAGFDERDMAHRYTNELAHCCKLHTRALSVI